VDVDEGTPTSSSSCLTDIDVPRFEASWLVMSILDIDLDWRGYVISSFHAYLFDSTYRSELLLHVPLSLCNHLSHSTNLELFLGESRR
jgi:hypothetical protein